MLLANSLIHWEVTIEKYLWIIDIPCVGASLSDCRITVTDLSCSLLGLEKCTLIAFDSVVFAKLTGPHP